MADISEQWADDGDGRWRLMGHTSRGTLRIAIAEVIEVCDACAGRIWTHRQWSQWRPAISVADAKRECEKRLGFRGPR